MSLTLLFDLDDTLLDTNIETFIPAYFQSLSNYLGNYVPSDLMLRSLVSGMKIMMESEDPSHTLEDVFDADFYPKLGKPKTELLDIINDYYDNIFPDIRSATRVRPDAAPLIDWAFARGYRIAIATDPLLPRKATFHRLRWAGLDPFQFEVVSTFENFHFSKTTPAYFAEVLGQLGWPEGPVLMVGNDIERDLRPANKLGLKTYLIDGDSASSPGFEAGYGKLADLRPWLESTDLSTLEPSYKSPEAVLAILESTPAALDSLTQQISDGAWNISSTNDDWALNEVICHLRDTEMEIHALQLKVMLERVDAFIPRPDTSVWASEREYAHVHGPTALKEFVDARIINIQLLKGLNPIDWERKARHAIFGPTDFLEVTSFIADHDRMHVQQAWNLLKSLREQRV
jgi:FMN phosphatase YigB (HAD superfamily)